MLEITNNETTYEHRDVAEEIIGRKLRPEEDVHHQMETDQTILLKIY